MFDGFADFFCKVGVKYWAGVYFLEGFFVYENESEENLQETLLEASLVSIRHATVILKYLNTDCACILLVFPMESQANIFSLFAECSYHILLRV